MSAANRNEAVDAVRALALIGICVVNLPFMALPADALWAQPDAPADQSAAIAIELLFQAKFFLLFSFVFGWGIEVQYLSAKRAAVPFSRRYLRRTAMLALLGILHAVLVFTGDILVLYALLGLGVWALRSASPRVLLGVAAAMIPVAMLCIAGLGLLYAEMEAPPSNPGLGGSYLETVQARLRDWPESFVLLVLFQGHLAFGAMLVGVAAARTGFFEHASTGRRWLARKVPTLLLVGLVCNTLYVLGLADSESDEPGLLALAVLLIAIGGPALSAVYLAAILRLSGAVRLPPTLILAGRNSLSAYVLQGVLAGLVFGGYGLGLFSELSYAALLPLSLAIALTAMALVGLTARLWGIGPLEYLLRRVTYS